VPARDSKETAGITPLSESCGVLDLDVDAQGAEALQQSFGDLLLVAPDEVLVAKSHRRLSREPVLKRASSLRRVVVGTICSAVRLIRAVGDSEPESENGIFGKPVEHSAHVDYSPNVDYPPRAAEGGSADPD
jgi:hypothetical protein